MHLVLFSTRQIQLLSFRKLLLDGDENRKIRIWVQHMPLQMESNSREETLRALHSPGELLMEYREEAQKQLETEKDERKHRQSLLPEEVRRIYEEVIKLLLFLLTK